jgi:hypothetical protein
LAKKLIENSMKAPKGRNKIACGIATGIDSRLFIKALKGRHKYFAPSGLVLMTIRASCGDATGYYIAPLWGCQRIFKQLLKIRRRVFYRVKCGKVILVDQALLITVFIPERIQASHAPRIALTHLFMNSFIAYSLSHF